MPTPPPSPPPTPTFDYFVTIKGPVERGSAFIDALNAHSVVREATFKPVWFKNSRPRPDYSIHVVTTQPLTEAWVKDVAQRSNAEVLGITEYRFGGDAITT